MTKRFVTKTLDEDLKAIGLERGIRDLNEQRFLGGVPIFEEEEEEDEYCPECNSKMKGDKCPKCGYSIDSSEESCKDKSTNESLKRCPDGTRLDSSGRRCVPVEDKNKSIFYGKTDLDRKKERWDKSGTGKLSALKSMRRSAKIEDVNDNEGIDPLDADEVNFELFDAIMELDFSNLDADDIDEILEGLKEKNEDDPKLENVPDDLRQRAEEVVDFLLSEAVAKRTRRAKAKSLATKASFLCPKGTRKDPDDPAGRRCVRSAKAVGGAGILSKIKRKIKRWVKSGVGKLSKLKSKRWAARREDIEISDFAMELMSLEEDVDTSNDESIRVDIIENIGNVLELLSEEFMDESVTKVFEESYESLVASWEAGRLDENIMEEDVFVAELKPVIMKIQKCLRKLYPESSEK